MKWTFKFGRFAGIDVYVHVTFLLLICWVALVHWQQGQSIFAVVAGVGFILAIFLCVVLHEFGHALTARRYGIKTLHKNDGLERAIDLTLAGSQKDFPVVDNGRIEGILTQTDLLKALAARDQHPAVTSAMQKNFIEVDPLEMLETAFAKLKDCKCHTLPVTLNGKLVGLLTMDNLGEYMRIQAALKG